MATNWEEILGPENGATKTDTGSMLDSQREGKEKSLQESEHPIIFRKR